MHGTPLSCATLHYPPVYVIFYLSLHWQRITHPCIQSYCSPFHAIMPSMSCKADTSTWRVQCMALPCTAWRSNIETHQNMAPENEGRMRPRGLDPLLFHAANVIMHGVASMLVCRWVWSMSPVFIQAHAALVRTVAATQHILHTRACIHAGGSQGPVAQHKGFFILLLVPKRRLAYFLFHKRASLMQSA